MPTVREYFVKEAADYLEQLRVWLEAASAGQVDAPALQRICRSLRGSAQIAREDRVHRAAAALESAARALAAGALPWSEDVAERAAATLSDLKELVTGAPDEAEGERLVQSVEARWQADGREGKSADAREAEGAGRTSGAAAADQGEFHAFAARVAAGILQELDRALVTLEADPLDREPLKQILRRQRALLGAVQLETLPNLAGTLNALDEVTRLVASTGAAVEGEWLEFYRAAREVLAQAVPAIERGQTSASPALAPLLATSRRLAAEHGGRQPSQPAAAATAHAAADPPARSEQPATAAQPGSPTAERVRGEPEPVPIEELLYRGDAALERALELRPFIERVVRDDADAGAAIEELFDLIRLGRE